MTFGIEVLLKGRDEVVEEVIDRDGVAPRAGLMKTSVTCSA